MLTILNLFGRSPLQNLITHMNQVSLAINQIPTLVACLKNEDYKRLEQVAEEISLLEHKADLIKNDIRNHLPKSYLLSIDRSHLLEFLTLQDAMADKAEDIAIIMNFKPLKLLPQWENEFDLFLKANLDAFKGAYQVVHEFHDLMESSFGGTEAEKVQAMIQEIGKKEHEVDLIQRSLFKKLLQSEDEMSYTTFYLWQKIISSIAEISNLSEKLANRIRMTLDLK